MYDNKIIGPFICMHIKLLENKLNNIIEEQKR